MNDWSVALRLPAEAEWLSIVRLFVASSGRQLELDPETVEDMKVVVTELCSAALERTSDDHAALTVEVRSTGDSAVVAIGGTGLTFHAITGGDARSQMLDALVPDIRMLDEGRAVEFRVFRIPVERAAPNR